MSTKGFLLVALALACLQLPHPAAAQTFITAWGSYGSGDQQFINPLGVAVGPSGDVYVSDAGNGRVIVFTSGGSYLRQWSLPLPWDPEIGHLGPVNIAVDANEDVYVTSDDMIGDVAGGGLVFKFTSTGTLLTRWGEPGSGPGQFDGVGIIAFDPLGNVWVGSSYGRVQVFTSSGIFLREWSPGGYLLAIDATGNVYLSANHGIRKVTSDGTTLTEWGGQGTGDGQFDRGPTRVAIGPDGNVFAVDHYLCRVQAFTSEGVFIAKWGAPGSSNGQFLGPVGITVDVNGDVYVADKNSSRIQRFGFAPTPTHSVTWGALKSRYRGAPGTAQPTTRGR